jgi:hypothetical protein
MSASITHIPSINLMVMTLLTRLIPGWPGLIRSWFMVWRQVGVRRGAAGQWEPGEEWQLAWQCGTDSPTNWQYK